MTIKYPFEEVQINNRHRAVHRLTRFIESKNERCIGCGLCEKIRTSNRIGMETSSDEKGRKKANNYSINLGRCIYCGFCVEVCPEFAIAHGRGYENAAEQRSYSDYKEDFLAPIGKLRNQAEFEGAGNPRKDADRFVEKTPQYYEVLQKRGQGLRDDTNRILPKGEI